jgi:hypothetical protein
MVSRWWFYRWLQTGTAITGCKLLEPGGRHGFNLKLGLVFEQEQTETTERSLWLEKHWNGKTNALSAIHSLSVPAVSSCETISGFGFNLQNSGGLCGYLNLPKFA